MCIAHERSGKKSTDFIVWNKPEMFYSQPCLLYIANAIFEKLQDHIVTIFENYLVKL